MDQWREWARFRGYGAARQKPRTLVVGMAASVAVAAAFGVFIWWAIDRGNAKYAEFMQGCSQDHKKYECMAMWRAGDKSDYPVIIPMPVPVSR